MGFVCYFLASGLLAGLASSAPASQPWRIPAAWLDAPDRFEQTEPLVTRIGPCFADNSALGAVALEPGGRVGERWPSCPRVLNCPSLTAKPLAVPEPACPDLLLFALSVLVTAALVRTRWIRPAG